MHKGLLNIASPVRLVSIRTTGLVLLLLLLLPLMFSPVRQLIFLSQSSEIRKLEPNSRKLEKMVFTASDFAQLNFTRNLREFIYRGNMYDIHSITRSGNQVEVLVLWDSPETTLLLAFQSQGKADRMARQGDTKVGFMAYFHVVPFIHNFQVATVQKFDYKNIAFIYPNPCIRICSPPPELPA